MSLLIQMLLPVKIIALLTFYFLNEQYFYFQPWVETAKLRFSYIL
jgi:hypothetical protein